MIKIWLDDIRSPPDDSWVWYKNFSDDLCGLIEGDWVEEISFDHDLGEEEKTGYDVAKLIEELAFNHKNTPIKWAIHSANPVGRKNIQMAMENAERYWGLR